MYSVYAQSYPYYQQNYQQNYQSYQQPAYQQAYGYSAYGAQQTGYAYSPFQYSSCQACRIPQAPVPQASSTPKAKKPAKKTESKSWRAIEQPPIQSCRGVAQSIAEVPISTQAAAPCEPCSGESLPPYVSKVEEQIRSSSQPIPASELDIIEINGIRGIWLNKAEVENWRGEIPISEYPINNDPNPELVRLKQANCADRVQELAIKYLKPPRPPTPGPIVIKQEPNVPTAPAPPIIIRQLAPEPCQPPPVVVRERPPAPPEPICAKTVTIPGQRLPPPPRRVIIEKLAQAPPQPQAVTVERWLPYDKRERRVVLEKKPCDPCVEKPKNIIFEWEPQCVNQKTEVRDLGVEAADPQQYAQAHGASLKPANELPQFVLDVKPPQSLDSNNEISLVGDVDALKLIDLNREGLIEYSKYVR